MLYLRRGDEEIQAYMDLIGVWSKNFVHDEVHWAQIEAAARMLVAKPEGKRRLSSKQVREICGLAVTALIRPRQAP
jgi:hypothetical protein